MQKTQIVLNEIKNRIESGIWRSGTTLPTEAELCLMFSVSRITIRKALDELSKDGLIKKIQGRGSIVAPSILNSGCATKGFSQHMESFGLKVKSVIVKSEIITANSEIRKNLSLNKNDFEVWHFRRIRLIQDEPIAIMDSYVKKQIGDKMMLFDLENNSFFYLYEKITGEKISENIGSITAIIPIKEDCKLMNVEYPSAQILYKSIAYLDSGESIQFDKSIFNSQRYEFTISLKDKPIIPISPISP